MKQFPLRPKQISSERYKLLVSLITCCLTTGMVVCANGSIKTQTEVDALQLGNGGAVTHTVDETNGVYSHTGVAYPSLGNIFSDADTLNVGGNASNKAALTFTGTYNGTKQVIYRGVNSGVANKSIDFSNLSTVAINAPFTGAGNVLTATGLIAYYGGSINVNPTVDKLDINLQTGTNKQAIGIESMGPTSSVTILSPVVSITMDGGSEANNVTSDAVDSNNSTITLGNDDHPLTGLTVTNTGTGGGPEGAIRAASGDTKGTVNIIAKTIDVENWLYGLRANGYFADKRTADINIGDANHYTDSLTIGGTTVKPEIPIHSVWDGNIDIYAKKVDLTAATSGIVAYTDSVVRLHTGSGDGEGLSITSDNQGIYSWKEYLGQGSGAEVSVLSGNVTINVPTNGTYSRAVQAGDGGAGTVNLGTASSPLNKVDITSGKIGVFSGGGDAHVYGKTVNVTAPTAVMIYPYFNGTTDIQGDQVTLTGNINTYSGDTKINDGGGNGTTVIVGNVKTGYEDNGNTEPATADISLNTANSYLQGYIKDSATLGATTLNAANSGVWKVTADSNLDTLNLTNGGTVDMSYDSGYQSVTTKHLTGGNGTLVFDTELQASADNKDVLMNSDKLYITDSSSGTHTIKVRDHSASLANNGYLLLIQDSSAAPGASFTADASIENGGLFAYKGVITDTNPTGYANVPTGSKNWYLTLDKTPPPTPPTPPTPPAPPTPEPPKPILTSNALANIGFAENRYVALFNEQDTLLKRLGELRNNRDSHGVWTRIRRGNEAVDNGYAGSGQYTTLQIGYDRCITQAPSLDRYLGVAYDHTSGSQDYDSVSARGEYSADTLTLYDTALYDKGHYWDIVGKIGKIRGNYDLGSDFPEYGDASAWYYSISGEYGRKKTIGSQGWYIEPQAQLTYSHLNGADYTSTQGTTGMLDAVNSLIFRTGTTIGRQWDHELSKTTPFASGKKVQDGLYAKLFWNHEFSGDSSYIFYDKNSATLSGSHDYGGSWWTVGIGTNLVLSNNIDFHLDLERNFGGEVTRKWLLNGGFRFEF